MTKKKQQQKNNNKEKLWILGNDCRAQFRWQHSSSHIFALRLGATKLEVIGGPLATQQTLSCLMTTRLTCWGAAESLANIIGKVNRMLFFIDEGTKCKSSKVKPVIQQTGRSRVMQYGNWHFGPTHPCWPRYLPSWFYLPGPYPSQHSLYMYLAKCLPNIVNIPATTTF